MEFNVPIPPYLRIETTRNYIYVDNAAPSIDRNCLYEKGVNMTFYMMYLPEMNFYADVYFDGIRKMMTLKNIEKYGQVVSILS